MARSHAKVLVQVWRDPDWVSLSIEAQWLYVLLLTQPKLTLVGSLEVTTGRWANYAPNGSREVVEDALSELRRSGKVIVDDDTDELLIRTFTAHDLDPNRINVNLAKGLWGHWAQIASAEIRRLAIFHMPDAIWDRLAPHAPGDAEQIRRWARLEPEHAPRLEPKETPRLEPPPSSHLPTETGHRPDGDGPEDGSVDNLPLVERAQVVAAKFGGLHAVASIPQEGA